MWRLWVEASIGSYAGRIAPPGMPKTVSTPAFSRARMRACAPVSCSLMTAFPVSLSRSCPAFVGVQIADPGPEKRKTPSAGLAEGGALDSVLASVGAPHEYEENRSHAANPPRHVTTWSSSVDSRPTG